MNDRHRASKRAKARIVKKTSTRFDWLLWKIGCSVQEASNALNRLGGKDRCLNAMMAIHIMSPMAGDGILMRRQLSKSSGSIKRRNNTGQEKSQRSAAGQM